MKISALILTCILASCASAPAYANRESSQAVQSVADSASSAVKAVSTEGANVATRLSDDTAGVLNHVIDKASVGLSQITSKLEAGAPEAWKLVVAGTRVKAEAGIIVGFLCLLWAVISWTVFGYNASKPWIYDCEPTKNLWLLFRDHLV